MVSLLAYSLAFLIIGIITVLPVIISKTRKATPAKELIEKPIEEKKPKVAEEPMYAALAAVAAYYVHKLKRVPHVAEPLKVTERLTWHLRARAESLQTLNITYILKRRRR